MNVVQRFDSWVEKGPLTPLDLGIYRVAYSVIALCVVPSIHWLADYPTPLYRPPRGPFQLLGGSPPLAVLVALELLRSLALLLLALGIWTRVVSIVVGALLLVTYGLTYTLGKI